MSDIIIVTNRKLCREPLIDRIEKLAESRPAAIILREKDLPEAIYRNLAVKALEICGKYEVKCVLHSFFSIAEELKADAIHVTSASLRSMTAEMKKEYKTIGASCHSVEDAVEAERAGSSYVTAGHIFDTDCKKGTPGRGINFLKEICSNVSIPVYAIGGITPNNAREVRQTGAVGICIMSGAMTAEDPKDFLSSFK